MRLFVYATKNISVKSYEVIEVLNTSTSFILKLRDKRDDFFVEKDLYIVTVSKNGGKSTCTCVYSEMMNCLCRHKVFSLLYMKGNDLIDDVEMKTSGNDDRNLGERLVMQQFDTCLLCEYVNNFVTTKIMDFSCDFIKREEIVAMNDMLLPPPRYQDKLKKN